MFHFGLGIFLSNYHLLNEKEYENYLMLTHKNKLLRAYEKYYTCAEKIINHEIQQNSNEDKKILSNYLKIKSGLMQLRINNRLYE